MVRFILSALAVCLALPLGAQTLEKITETKSLKLGFRTDAAPLSFLDEAGNPAGYSPLLCAEVAQGIANALQMAELSVEFVPVDTGDRFERVASGEIDLHCGAASVTLSRRAMVDFSIPVFVDGTSLILPKDAPGQFADLDGKKIGVRAETTTEEALNNSLQAAGITAEVVAVTEHAAGMDQLQAGTIDAYFADQSILAYYFVTWNMGDNFKVANEILTVEPHGLVMARGDADFRLLVDTVLSQMYTDGRLIGIFKAALPGIQPGAALNAMFLLAPVTP